MKFFFPFLGKTKEKFIAQGIDEYVTRLKHYANLEMKFLKEKKSAAKLPPNQQNIEEGKVLLASVPAGSFVVVLDVKGNLLSSEQLAEQITRWEDQGKRQVVFLLGGPNGFSDEVLKRADLRISLSKMTFTHDLARLLLIEQLYRAYTIKAGTGYHK